MEKWVVYSDCKICGMIEVENNGKNSISTPIKTDLIKATLVFLFIIAVGLSGLFYYQISQNQLFIEDIEFRYLDLYDRYLSLFNTTSSIELYYDELQDMYLTLRDEYSDLDERYSTLLQEKEILLSEYDDVINFGKEIILENSRNYTLSPEDNITLTYDLIYAGFIELNFTSSTDIYIWIGSSVTENEYYARLPSYPRTTSKGAFTIPVCATIHIHIMNPNESEEAIINLTIKYVY